VAAKVIGHSTELKWFVDESCLPAGAEHQGRGSDVFSQRAKRKVAYLIESFSPYNIARSSAPGNAQGVFDWLANVNEEVERLAEWIARRSVVEQLWRASEGHLRIDEQVRHDGTDPVGFGNLKGISKCESCGQVQTNHISIKSGHELASTARHSVYLVQTIVEVARLEVVRHSWELGSRLVVQVRIGICQIPSKSLQTCTLSIIQDDDAELVLGVVLGAGGSDSVQDQIVVFTAASNEDIDRGHIVANQPQLRPAPLLQSEHGPEVLEHDRYGNADLDSDEDPGKREGRSPCLLSCDDEGDSQGEVQPVKCKRQGGQEGRKVE